MARQSRMGHNSLNRPILEPLGVNRSDLCPDSSGLREKREADKMNNFASTISSQKGVVNSLPKDCTDSLPNKNWICAKGVTLVFNIGPSFFHLLSMNKNTGRSFNYLFDYVNGVGSVKDKFDSSSCKVPLQKSHKMQTSYSKLNGRRSSVIKLNVFKEKCVCEKCLSGSYLFFGTQASSLRYELLGVLSSEHCKHWDDNWIKILIEQIHIFFCCIKDGIIYERLLESASLCSKMLLVKTPIKELLEFKYSYISFHLYFMYEVTTARIYNRKVENVKNSRQNVQHSGPFFGTGKEEREVIDGVSVVSFKTEADMNEYTDLEVRFMDKIKSPSPISHIDDEIEIVPTKTTDITKIKGWRNKLFSPLGSPRDHKKDNVIREIDSYKKKSERISEKKFDKLTEMSVDQFTDITSTEKVQEKVAENFLEKDEKISGERNQHFENTDVNFPQGNVITSDKESEQVLDKISEKLSQVTLPINEIEKNLENIEDSADRKLEALHLVKKEEHITTDLDNLPVSFSPESRKPDNDNKIKNSVFESDVLDDYLKNNSRLNISYEIPKLHAAEKLSNRNEMKKQNDRLIPKVKLEKLPDDIEQALLNEEITIKQEPLERNEVDGKVSIRNLKGTQKNCGQSNFRYIWVQGRPIQIVNGIREEEFMVAKNIRSSPPMKVCLKKSTESQTEFFGFDFKDNRVEIKEESEDNSEIDSKRPRLLTSIADEETDCMLKKFEPPTNFGPSYIPVAHGCSLYKLSNHCMCRCKTFSLGMILTIGKGRSLCNDAIENLEALKPKDNIINMRMAVIAASAVSTGSSLVETRRTIVPVVSKNIINSVKNWEQRLAYDKIAQTVPSARQLDIDSEVRDVVTGLVNYAERKLEPVEILYDPVYISPSVESPRKIKKEKAPKTKSKVVRELRKLINVSIIDESQDSELVKSVGNCGNDFCSKGCVCHSLNNRLNFPLHCGKMSCLFECSCPDREVYEHNTFKADQLSDIVLAKEEMTWHQTIIRSEDGDRIEVMNSVDKSKREKKLPTRFRNNVLLGKEMLHPAANSALPNKVPHSSPEPQRPVELPAMVKGESLKKFTLKRRLGFCSGTFEGRRSLADVFIWCGIHDKYNCLCVSWICRLKNNAFIWKPEKTTRYLPHKIMTEMELAPKYEYVVHLYDQKRFCARTYGAPIEYVVRNRSETFLTKRKCELENEVISSTNSYIKMKFFLVKESGNKCDNYQTEFEKEVFKASKVENVYIRPVSSYEEDVEDIEVVDDFPPIVIDYVTVEPDNVEDCLSDSAFEEESSEIVTIRRGPSVRTPKGLVLPGKPIKPLIKPPIKSYGRIQKSVNEQFICKTSPRQTHLPKNIDINEKRKRQVETDPLAINSTDLLQHSVTDFEKVTTKKKKITIVSQEIVKDVLTKPAAHMPHKDKVDTELENELIRLENHPLKDSIFGPDNLPKLALLCLTPGIGYLPIMEFHPEILAVQDPVFADIYHSFKNLDSANLWLNRFFKNRLIFETIDTSLKWVIVKPGILKLKHSPPFSPALLENPSIVVTKDGGLIFKKKDYNTGGICRGAIKVEPLTLAGGVHQVVTVKEHSDNKRKIAHLSTETIVDIRDSEGKRRKIQLETVPLQAVQSEQVLKRQINLFRQFPSTKVQESTGTTPFLRLNMDGVDKNLTSLQVNNSTIRSAVRPLIVSGSVSSPLRLQVSPSGITNLCSRNIISARSLSPPPLAIRSDVVTTAARGYPIHSISNPPYTGSKIVTRDGRPVIIHKNAVLPINVKEL